MLSTEEETGGRHSRRGRSWWQQSGFFVTGDKLFSLQVQTVAAGHIEPKQQGRGQEQGQGQEGAREKLKWPELVTASTSQLRGVG